MGIRTVIASASKLAYPSACDHSQHGLCSASVIPTTGKIRQNIFRISLLLLMPLVSSCMLESQVQEQVRVQVTVEGSGLVTAENSSINCQLDAEAVCDVVYSNVYNNVYNNAVSETFHAFAADDWQFVKWLSYPGDACHESTDPVCVYDFSPLLAGSAGSASLQLSAVFVNAYQQHGDQWNAMFEGDPGMVPGWTGGDHGKSVALPYCEQCPPVQRYRRLWMFGDSIIGSVDEDGYRITVEGDSYPGETPSDSHIYGNIIAIAYHGNTNTAQAQGVEYH